MRQVSAETLARFKHRFDTVLKQFRSVAAAEDQAIDFIKWLDPARYRQLQMDLDNNAAMNIASYPTDLQNAYTVVSQYRLSETDVSEAVPQQPAFAAVKAREEAEEQREVLSKKKKTGNRKGNGDVDNKHDDVEKLERFPCSLCGERTHKTHKCPFLEEAVKAVRLKTTEAALLGRHHQDDAEDFVDPEALVGY